MNAAVTGGTGYTPLHYASRAGKLEAASLLLEHGDYLSRIFQCTTALRLKCKSPFVYYVIGAEVDSLTKAGGATPLHRAAAMGHTELARY